MTRHDLRPGSKAEWRKYLLEQRRKLPATLRAAEAELLAEGVVATARSMLAAPSGTNVTDSAPNRGTSSAAAPSAAPPASPSAASSASPSVASPATTAPSKPGADGSTACSPPPASSAPSSTSPNARLVCCYVPLGDEPGSLAMLDALREAGYDVLVPIVPVHGGRAVQPPRPLDWAPYQGTSSLTTGPYGLRQPPGPGHGPKAITAASLVFVPALAVDVRGVRLGRGAGWYDRSLPLVSPGTPLVAILRDSEVVDALPAEPHDVLMTGVLTPHQGPRKLPLS